MRWKALPFASEYEASDSGLIRRLASRPLRPDVGKSSCRVTLCPKDAPRWRGQVAEAVLCAFVGDGYGADHINGDPHDNRLENLRWSVGPEAEWRPAPGAPDYLVSEDGRVRRVGRRRLIQGEIIDGYHRVSLKLPDGSHRRFVAHRLVLLAFVGDAADGEVCRHLDGNPGNNHLSNLRWGTQAANQQDRVRHGTHGRGNRNGNASGKLDEEAVRRIRSCPDTSVDLAREYGVAPCTVSAVRTGRLWAHVEP